MKQSCKHLLTLVLSLAAAAAAQAQTMSTDELFQDNGSRRRMRLRMEWSVFAGATLTGLTADSESISFDPKVGWHAGFDMGLLLSRRCAVVPELIFTHTAVDIKGRTDNVMNVKSNGLELPLLFEYRILRGRLRFYAGPSFTLMDRNDCTYGGESMDGFRFRPIVTYVVGVRGVIGRRVTVGARFNGRFNRTEQIMGYNIDDPDYETYRMGGRRVSISVGYRF